MQQSHTLSHLSFTGRTWNMTHYSVSTKIPATGIIRQRRQSVSSVAAPPRQPPVTRSMPPEKAEVFKSLRGWVNEANLSSLKSVEKMWQPHDFLPDSSLPLDAFEQQVRDLRERTSGLPDEYLVILVGDMITEEALPTYMSMINRLDWVKDETGCSTDPWAVWTRSWTAEENRHGDLLKTYLYLSGRVNMLSIERTIQYLIGAGMGPGTENNPYMGYVYTSFQERATFVTHGNTARLAKEKGDSVLARICGTIASDEKRHENMYVNIVEKLLEVDPSDAMLGIAEMMHKKITMPAHLMQDGQDPHIYDHYSTVAQRIGVYTAADYADILEFLVGRWKLEKIEGLNSAARQAQDYVCGLPHRYRKLQERAHERALKMDPQTLRFSWIFDKEITL